MPAKLKIKLDVFKNVMARNSLMVLVFVISYLALTAVYGKNVESFAGEVASDIDKVMGWQGNNDSVDGPQTEESCRQLALKNPEKYVAWGYRTSNHPTMKNTCLLYTSGFAPFAGNPSDNAHTTGCLRPGEKVAIGCKVPVTTQATTCDTAACNKVIDSYIAKNWAYTSSDFGECKGCPVVGFPNRVTTSTASTTAVATPTPSPSSRWAPHSLYPKCNMQECNWQLDALRNEKKQYTSSQIPQCNGCPEVSYPDIVLLTIEKAPVNPSQQQYNSISGSVVATPTVVAPAAPAAAPACPRPNGWCAHPGSTYKNGDCIGDGVQGDHLCWDTAGQRGTILRSNGCKSEWPNAPVNACAKLGLPPNVTAPVAVPVPAPVATPIAAPVATPVTSPVAAPVTSPVMAPAPIAPSPSVVSSPVVAPKAPETPTFTPLPGVIASAPSFTSFSPQPWTGVVAKTDEVKPVPSPSVVPTETKTSALANTDSPKPEWQETLKKYVDLVKAYVSIRMLVIVVASLIVLSVVVAALGAFVRSRAPYAA